jgi:tetratricopeptide (TPR) repeat protein
LLNAATTEPLLVHIWESDLQDDPKEGVGKKVGEAINAILNARDLSNVIQQKIDPGLRNEAAREAIVAGRELMFRYSISDLDKAIDLFNRALRAEPGSSLAHAYLASAAICRTHFISDDNFLKLGETEAYEAIRLAPTSREAHRTLAGMFYQKGKFAEALEEGLMTVESSGPEERIARVLGMILDAMGHPDIALRWHTFAGNLGGRSSDGYGLIGDCWVKLGDDEKGLQAYGRALELQPGSPQGGVGLSHMRLLQGDFESARKLCRSNSWTHSGLGEVEQIAAQIEFFARRFDVAEKLYADLSRTDVNGGGSFYGAVSYQSALGRAKWALGDSTGAKTLLERCLETERAAVKRTPTNPEALYRLAAVESSLGMSEPSIGHLREAVSSGWIDYRSLAMDPRFDAVQEEPRFKEILKDLAFKVADMRLKSQKTNYKNMEDLTNDQEKLGRADE